jgi:hypothetical protein
VNQAKITEALRKRAEKYGRPQPSWRDSDATKRREQGLVDAYLAGANDALAIGGALALYQYFEELGDYQATVFYKKKLEGLLDAK